MNRGPFILKAGFALLLSLAGLFAARHRPRRRRRAISPPAYPRRPPPPLHLPDLEPVPVPSAGVLDEELPMNQAEEALAKISPPAPVTMADDSVAMEEEIKNLRNLVQCLQERESCLEMKLLEYHGLKEQEVSMRELHNRLQLSATETKLLSLKIESLKAENEKLRAEASDYCRVASELEAQRKKNSVLENKLKSVGEQAKEKMAVLHGRITEIREKEKKELEDSVEVEKKLKLLNKIENDVIELRKENSRLAQEKLAIMKKLESEHMLNPTVIRSPDSVLKSPELGTLEEQNQLREENENLKKKLEQLQTDRCEDVEELVYLRWINACLRYELRHHQPPPGRTVARDLSRCLSPKSEQKAKQLILDYSNSHLNSNRSNSMDFDLDDCFSQTSSEDFDDNSVDSSKTKSSKSSKSKLFNKLKKLVLPKSRNEDKMMPARTRSDLNSERRASISTCAIDDCNEKWQIKRNHYHDPTSSSLDIQNLRRIKQEGDDGGRPERCNSDVGAVYAHKRMLSLDESSIYSGPAEYEESADPTKERLKKFAQVFKDSMGSLKHKRIPASLSIS